MFILCDNPLDQQKVAVIYNYSVQINDPFQGRTRKWKFKRNYFTFAENTRKIKMVKISLYWSLLDLLFFSFNSQIPFCYSVIREIRYSARIFLEECVIVLSVLPAQTGSNYRDLISDFIDLFSIVGDTASSWRKYLGQVVRAMPLHLACRSSKVSRASFVTIEVSTASFIRQGRYTRHQKYESLSLKSFWEKCLLLQRSILKEPIYISS